jgi:xanthine dehydrogenase accessory factor
MIEGDLAVRVEQLLSERAPFVMATVVRARHPTSVRPGDAAVVLGDGTIEGFVGGVCAESSVRLHSLRAMETGEPLLLRLIPDPSPDDTDSDPVAPGTEAPPTAAATGVPVTAAATGAPATLDGAVVERNPCLSGGALEIFLEPHLPPARMLVVGNSPIAVAVETLARASGYDCTRVPAGAGVSVGGAAAVVVASHGNGEEDVLAEALRAGAPYVALVASRVRGAAVREGLEVAPELAAELQTPAGLDIGARTPAEIAISILAQLVARGHAHPGQAAAAPVCAERAPSAVEVATDPICGMKVAVTASTPRLEAGGTIVYFCGDQCRQAFAAQHAEAHAVG